MTDVITPDTLPEGGNPTDGEGTASGEMGESLTLPELNEYLGKDYKTKEAALKSLKDTMRFVGKANQPREESPAPKLNDELASTVRELQQTVEEERFLRERPELAPYMPTLRELRNGTGKSLAELSASEAVKPLLEKALAQDETQKKRSVLESNTRLGQVRDKINESRDALKGGNFAQAKDIAVQSVVDMISGE